MGKEQTYIYEQVTTQRILFSVKAEGQEEAIKKASEQKHLHEPEENSYNHYTSKAVHRPHKRNKI